MSKLGRKRISYEAGYKLKVVEYAELHGNSNAIRFYANLGNKTFTCQLDLILWVRLVLAPSILDAIFTK